MGVRCTCRLHLLERMQQRDGEGKASPGSARVRAAAGLLVRARVNIALVRATGDGRPGEQAARAHFVPRDAGAALGPLQRSAAQPLCKLVDDVLRRLVRDEALELGHRQHAEEQHRLGLAENAAALHAAHRLRAVTVGTVEHLAAHRPHLGQCVEHCQSRTLALRLCTPSQAQQHDDEHEHDERSEAQRHPDR